MFHYFIFNDYLLSKHTIPKYSLQTLRYVFVILYKWKNNDKSIITKKRGRGVFLFIKRHKF